MASRLSRAARLDPARGTEELGARERSPRRWPPDGTPCGLLGLVAYRRVRGAHTTAEPASGSAPQAAGAEGPAAARHVGGSGPGLERTTRPRASRGGSRRVFRPHARGCGPRPRPATPRRQWGPGLTWVRATSSCSQIWVRTAWVCVS